MSDPQPVEDPVVREVSSSLVGQADRHIDQYHEDFARLGERLFMVFPPDPKNDRISTQIRNLQQVVNSATRFADIEDFVKNQMGKDRSKDKPWRAVGDEILEQLRTLRAVQVPRSATEADRLRFRLRLARGWVRAAVSEYLYRFALRQMEQSHG